MILLFLFSLCFSDNVLQLETQQSVEAHVRFLSDDLLEGRETTYPGQKVAARYIAGHFARFGIESLYPDQEDRYYQVFNLYRTRVHPDKTMVKIGEKAMVLDRDFGFAGFHPEEGTVTGPVVFLGYPYKSKKYQYDAFADVDLTGKILVALDGYPEHLAEKFKDTQRRRQHAREKKVKWARKANAVAIVFIHADDFGVADFRPDPKEKDDHGSRLSEKPAKLGGSDFPVIELAPGMAKVFLGEAFTRVEQHLATLAKNQAPEALHLSEINPSIVTVFENQELPTENVLGLLRGTDPKLRDEYIVVSAHYDHIGKRGEAIFNGADDNASGTALLLELSRRMSPKPLKRSVVFLALTAEEKGLIGSRRFLAEGPISPEKIVANINLDMVGRNESETLGVIPAKNKDISTLNEWTNEANQQQERPFTFIEEFDQYHHRSDHYNFAKRDIPAIFFFAGDHDDYHKATDTYEKINFDKIVRVGGLVESLLDIAGNHPTPPVFTNRGEAEED